MKKVRKFTYITASHEDVGRCLSELIEEQIDVSELRSRNIHVSWISGYSNKKGIMVKDVSKISKAGKRRVILTGEGLHLNE